MDPTITLLCVLLIFIPESTLLAALGSLVVGARPRWFQVLAVGTLQAVAAYLIRSAPVPFGVHTLVLAAALSILIRVLVRVDWWAALLGALFVYNVLAAIETVSIPVLLYLTDYSAGEMLQHWHLRFLFFLPQGSVLSLLTWLCWRFDFRLFGPPPGFDTERQEWRTLNRSFFLVYVLTVLPVLLLSIVNVAFFASRTGVFPDRYVTFFLTGISVAVLVLAALTPVKIQAISRALVGLYAARKTAENLAHVGELLRLIRRQHHDFHHQLQTVYGLLETGCYEEAQQYIRKTYQSVSGPLELVRTDHPAVTALLYTKAALAEAKKIEFELVIECSLHGLPLDPMEITSLFGNIIDNALEAVESAPLEERKVRLEARREPDNYVITVANRGRINALQVARAFQTGYTTKRGHTGMGLVYARKVVEKYGGEIAVSWSDTETKFRIVLPVAEKKNQGEEPEKEKAGPGQLMSSQGECQ
ncbi:MAG: GHKL domain-containing protein [Bacillota bacterium]